MKKIIVGFILAVMLLSTSICVMAEEFSEIGMKIELPDEYYDLKSGIDNNDTKISYYETVLRVTSEELKNQYNQNGIVYNGLSSNLSKELIISVIENTRTKNNFHLTSLDEKEIEDLKKEILATAGDAQVEEQNLYEHNEIKYIYTKFINGTTTIYQYYTIVNGKAITITLNSKYSNVQQDELKNIVDTIQFNEIQEKPIITVSPIMIAGIIIVIIVIIIITIIKKKNK